MPICFKRGTEWTDTDADGGTDRVSVSVWRDTQLDSIVNSWGISVGETAKLAAAREIMTGRAGVINDLGSDLNSFRLTLCSVIPWLITTRATDECSPLCKKT